MEVDSGVEFFTELQIVALDKQDKLLDKLESNRIRRLFAEETAIYDLGYSIDNMPYSFDYIESDSDAMLLYVEGVIRYCEEVLFAMTEEIEAGFVEQKEIESDLLRSGSIVKRIEYIMQKRQEIEFMRSMLKNEGNDTSNVDSALLSLERMIGRTARQGRGKRENRQESHNNRAFEVIKLPDGSEINVKVNRSTSVLRFLAKHPKGVTQAMLKDFQLSEKLTDKALEVYFTVARNLLIQYGCTVTYGAKTAQLIGIEKIFI